jgi:hypothetical protein
MSAHAIVAPKPMREPEVWKSLELAQQYLESFLERAGAEMDWDRGVYRFKSSAAARRFGSIVEASRTISAAKGLLEK